jgi:hypothetical protein
MRRQALLSERRFQPRDAASGEPERDRLDAMVAGTYGLRERTCQVVLDDLVLQGRLRRGSDGRYARSC